MQDKGKDIKASSHRGKSERHKLFWNIVFLIAAIVYTISPMDIIPDILGPLGFTDDIFLWAVIVGASLFKWLRKGKSREFDDRGGFRNGRRNGGPQR
jgi:uncharacterized membrane protein YkvA (DUF1232 family)